MNSLVTWNYHNKNGSVLLAILSVISFSMLFLPLEGIAAELSIFLFFIFSIPIIIFYKKVNRQAYQIIIWSFVYIFQIVLYSLLGISTAVMGYIARYFGWALVGVIGALLFRIFSKKKRKHLFYFIYFSSVVSILYLIVIGRLTASSGGESTSLTFANYSTMISIFFGSMLIWILNTGKSAEKIFAWFGLLISGYANIIILQRTLAILMMLFSVILIIMYNAERARLTKIVWFFILLLLYIIYETGSYVSVLNWIGSITGSQRVMSRMNWLIRGITIGDMTSAGGSVAGRAHLVERSWNTWLSSWQNFLFGVGDQRTGGLIGNHSDIIDTLARFGLVGGIVFVKLSTAHFKYMYHLINESTTYKKQCAIVFILYIIRGGFGNIFTPAIAVQVFLFLPLLYERCYHISQRNDRKV